ncbi:hypothetical protein R1flu_014497 [Riccia fluitans]|uniref:Uncharacterized protein n=1 Tax=Riccia fluitans TaxID=41844 RepID=A0ABD1YGN7_9MARC
MAELGGANRLTHVMAGEQDPIELQLQRAVPVLEQCISVMHQDFSAKVYGISLQLSQQTEEIKGLRQRLEDILSGKAEIRLTARYGKNFYRLYFANVCHGLAISLFPISLEAWLVSEHERLGFRQEWLCKTFWLMALGTRGAAIGVGAFADLVLDWCPPSLSLLR